MARFDIFTLVLLAVIHLAMSAMIAPSAQDFFKGINGNLTKITWKHAVNDKARLNSTMHSDVMMLEADVVYGTLKSNTTMQLPVMAHPPNTTSDLSLEEFLDTVFKNGTKGVKLDFKSIEAFNHSLVIIEKLKDRMVVPVWMNADILMGPVNATMDDAKPVHANQFLSTIVQKLPQSVISVGWVTKYGMKYNIKTGNYSSANIDEMLKTLKDNNVAQNVTFAVRAGLALNDVDSMKKLVKDNPKATLTIWSSDDDEVDGKKLSNLILEIGVDKVYVDVPEAVWKTLDLHSGSKGGSSYLSSSVVLTFATSILSALFVTRML